MPNNLHVRFKVVPAEGDAILTTSDVDANYQASQLKCASYFEELYRENDPDTVLKSIEHATEPTDDPSPEELQRRKDKSDAEAAQQVAQQQADAPKLEEPEEEKEPIFGLRVPSGTSRMPHNFREDPKHRDYIMEKGEVIPPPLFGKEKVLQD